MICARWGVGVLGGLGLLACSTPTPAIAIALAGPPDQACPATNCDDVAMPCSTVMSIRIIDPVDGTIHLDQCTTVIPNGGGNMCALARVNLASTPLPVRDLEVQIAVFPATEVTSDPGTSDLVCPKVTFAATGYPVAQAPAPALGGRGFYHPGDELVHVTLGCTDLAAIKDSCEPDTRVTVTATIDEFETRLPVSASSTTAAQLRVSVGEPHASGTEFVLNPADIRDLAFDADSSSGGVPATWTNDIDNLVLNKYACIEVLDEDAQSPGTLSCRPATVATQLNLTGTLLTAATVNKVLALLSTDVAPKLPAEGLTIGMVVDQSMTPASGYVVTSSGGSGSLGALGTVSYLTDGGLGGSATADSGIFVSRDAPFGTQFSISGPGRPTVVGTGGLVHGKITVVILAAPVVQ